MQDIQELFRHVYGARRKDVTTGMKKEDIIKIVITERAGIGNEDQARASLAWDDSKGTAFYTNDFDGIEDATKSAIGELWQEYGDEIILYIGRNIPLYKCFDTDKTLCSRCGITLPPGLPYGLTLHMCDPLRPIPFITPQEQVAKKRT